MSNSLSFSSDMKKLYFISHNDSGTTTETYSLENNNGVTLSLSDGGHIMITPNNPVSGTKTTFTCDNACWQIERPSNGGGGNVFIVGTTDLDHGKYSGHKYSLEGGLQIVFKNEQLLLTSEA